MQTLASSPLPPFLPLPPLVGCLTDYWLPASHCQSARPPEWDPSVRRMKACIMWPMVTVLSMSVCLFLRPAPCQSPLLS